MTPLGEEVASVAVVLESLQFVPEAYASAKQGRDDHDVHVVDEPGGKEVAVVAVAQEDVEVEPLLDPEVSREALGADRFQGASVQPMRSA